MIIMLSGPNKKMGFNEKIKEILNKELSECNSLVAIASSENSEKNLKYFNGNDNSLGVKGMFGALKVKIDKYYLLDYKNSEVEMKKIIQKSDIIYLMGGDPFLQLKLIKKVNFIKLFENKIIIGVSAGSMNLAKKAYYSKDDEYPKSCFYDGLGLVDLTIDPHFDIENKEQVYEATKNSIEHTIIGLPNDSAIVIKDNDIMYIGEHYIFKNGKLN